MPGERKKVSPVVAALFILIGFLVAIGVFEYLYLRASDDSTGFQNIQEAVFQKRAAAASEYARTCPIQDRVAFSASKGEVLDASDIYIACLSNNIVLNITNNEYGSFAPRLSPDGSLIYYYAPRDGSLEFNDWEIWVSDLSGKNKRRLSDNPLADTFPTLSPDGSKLAFTSNDEGTWRLHVMDSDGSNEFAVPGTNGVFNAVFASNDTIIFTQHNDKQLQDLFEYDLSTGEVVQIINDDVQESSPAVSPSGEYILFGRKDTGNFEIYRVDRDGTNELQLTDTGSNSGTATFSYDGKKVIFVSDRRGTSELYSMTIHGTDQALLIPGLTLKNVRNPSFAASGE